MSSPNSLETYSIYMFLGDPMEQRYQVKAVATIKMHLYMYSLIFFGFWFLENQD